MPDPILLFEEKVDPKYLQEQLDKEKRMKTSSEVRLALESAVVGQPQAIEAVIPFVQLWNVQLSPEGRPVGIIMLLGPTGTGKTHLVESLALALHGNAKTMLKVDCGEYQADHEIAKLVGAPPGYLGHRETTPVFAQKNLNAACSDGCGMQIVLFDEIEKAAPSMTRLMLSILDKATLKLGDGTSVSFENSLIFMTSNLGASAMQKSSRPDFGLEAFSAIEISIGSKKLQSIGHMAVRKKFSPEFINRIDSVITYNTLTREGCEKIFLQIADKFSKTIKQRLGLRSFKIIITPQAKDEILKQGVSVEYGARELRRVFQRTVVLPLAKLIEDNYIPPQGTCIVDFDEEFDIIIKP